MTAFWVSLHRCVSLMYIVNFQDSYRARAARAVYVHLYAAMRLGYYISPTKSSLVPTQSMIHLGFGIDAANQCFSITDKYRRKFRASRSALLERKTANLLDLQKWLGKCCHLKLVFPAQSLFTYQCRQLFKTFGDERQPLPQEMLEELEFWSFVDTCTDPIPFFYCQHVSLTLYTDASGFGWGAHLLLPSGPSELRDYWSTDLFSFDICVKEALAALFALQSIEGSLFRRRIDIYVDNEGLVHAWEGLKTRSCELTRVLQSLFLFCLDSRIHVKMIWVPTDKNPADAPSRVLDRSDAMINDLLRQQLRACFGPFKFDLMASPSNVMTRPDGRPLPFFSRFPLPASAGTNVFAQRPPCSDGLYVFPPFKLIEPLGNLLREWGGVEVTVVLPVYPGCAGPWMDIFAPYVQEECILFTSSSSIGALRFPSSRGFRENLLPLAFGLSAFRCRFPSRPALPAPVLSPPVRVLMIADSMLRPLSALSWPAPFRVIAHSHSGATLEQVLQRGLDVAACDVLVIHAGVNDVSKFPEGFEAHFERACGRVVAAVAAGFPQCKVVVSTVCQTKADDLNLRVASANRLLRGLARSQGWALVSNDNIHFADLHDVVHLNAAGTARLYRNLLNGLRSLYA